jgi:hypothetical protein
MYNGDTAGSIVGHVTRHRLTFLRRQSIHQRCLAVELAFEDAEIWRFYGTQGLHIERIAACPEARHLARKRQVLLDVIFSEMRGVLGLIVEDEELVHKDLPVSPFSMALPAQCFGRWQTDCGPGRVRGQGQKSTRLRAPAPAAPPVLDLVMARAAGGHWLPPGPHDITYAGEYN